MKKIGTLARLLTVLVLIVGIVSTLQISGKVVSTGVRLMILRDNAIYYNEQYHKTDTMTETYNENHAERQKFYNSEDPIIRGYSNLGTMTKLLCFFLALAMFPGVALVCFYVLISFYFKRVEKRLKRFRRCYERRKLKNDNYS